MKPPYTVAELRAGIGEAVRANPGAELVKISAYYPGVSLDVLPVDPQPDVALAAFTIADIVPGGARASAGGPARLQIAASVKMPARVLSPQVKIAAAYTHAALAKQRARAAGFHDVLFLDERGGLTESSAQSFFLVVDGQIRTAPLDCVLDGVTRRVAVELARDEGIEVKEEPMPRELLARASEAFLTGTTTNVWPIAVIDSLELPAADSRSDLGAAGRPLQAAGRRRGRGLLEALAAGGLVAEREADRSARASRASRCSRGSSPRASSTWATTSAPCASSSRCRRRTARPTSWPTCTR